ncbi:hypothetical protein HPB48_016297 [Haemaphysalis longicornis]|uniref:SCP domain-containing protein n=1 Tax=Haemaphysalis longicornis TaxID=44386 RepID=A0A9J6GBA8_HAELO|nr:hypothetical protein HPB48_016297 [Haemaphysalis longicornis]
MLQTLSAKDALRILEARSTLAFASHQLLRLTLPRLEYVSFARADGLEEYHDRGRRGNFVYAAGPLVTTTFSRHGTAHALCRAEYYNVTNGLTHTACLPPKRGCQLIVSGLTDDEKREALRAHNEYRSQVAQGRLSSYPPASNMYRLIWDEELADVAQAFTNQCDNSDHDKKEQRITTRFQKVGQNFHWNEGFGILPGPDAKGRIDDFFAEYKDFNPSNVDPFSTSRTRGVVTHFTQVRSEAGLSLRF